jgi:AcrR family transcriptional regulator
VVAKIIDKEQKRYDIARAAMEVFCERGFESASMSRVAGKAGVGKGTIYEYFPSKDELIATSIRLWMEEMIAEAERALEILRTIFCGNVPHG